MLVQLKDIRKYYYIRGGFFRKQVLRAVDKVSLHLISGETLALVGESGCGKTTCGLITARLIKPDSGQVIFKGQDLFQLTGRSLQTVRRQIQVVLQNPLSSLDPRMRIYDGIIEPLRIHQKALKLSRESARKHVLEMAKVVGLREEDLLKLPRQLSGGQQQRACICRALVLSPVLVILDEPTSALDVSVQAKVLNLLLDLRSEYGLTYLFITHNMGVARYVANRVAVMYLGKIVEIGEAEEVLSAGLHPYTSALMKAVLAPSVPLSSREPLRGEPEMPVGLSKGGCVFQNRCKEVTPVCREATVPLVQVYDGHYVRCLKFATHQED